MLRAPPLPTPLCWHAGSSCQSSSPFSDFLHLSRLRPFYYFALIIIFHLRKIKIPQQQWQHNFLGEKIRGDRKNCRLHSTAKKRKAGVAAWIMWNWKLFIKNQPRAKTGRETGTTEPPDSQRWGLSSLPLALPLCLCLPPPSLECPGRWGKRTLTGRHEKLALVWQIKD